MKTKCDSLLTEDAVETVVAFDTDMWYQINRFHLLAFATWQFVNFHAGQNIFGIYSNNVPKWRCGDSEASKNCSIYVACPKEKLSFVDPVFHSAAMEFDWICGSSAYYQSFFSQIQYSGVLIGTFLFGSLSDRFGRKPIGILVMTIAITSTFASGLAPNVHLLFGLRFFVGLSIGGTLVVIGAWIMEVILAQQRMVLRGCFNWGWTRVFLTCICYLTREWRLASFGLTGRMIESEKQIARIAGISYVTVEHKTIAPKSLCETLKTKGLLKKLIILWIMWFIVAVCGFANDLNSNNLAGDLYLNQVLFGVLLVFSKMLLLFVDTHFKNFKRRTLHQGSQIGTLICFITLTVFLLNDYHGFGFLVVYLLGTAFIEYTWDACYLCAIELMETSTRASATGSCSMLARVGSILAPFLTYANTYWPAAVYVTVIGMGTVNLLVSCLFLPESKNVNLDDVHVDDDDDEQQQQRIPEELPMLVQKVRE
uniref:MFS domain-containing protein n=1 Tax=Caenorhabditis japonica TaxID=281687 RepID=A0A8R1HGV8_CAEJA